MKKTWPYRHPYWATALLFVLGFSGSLGGELIADRMFRLSLATWHWSGVQAGFSLAGMLIGFAVFLAIINVTGGKREQH